MSKLNEQQVTDLMAARGISRKSAVQFLRRQGKKAAPAPVAKKTRKDRGKPFDIDKAIALYKQGITVPNIAVELGYKKGQGQNRTRGALRTAGVYKERA